MAITPVLGRLAALRTGRALPKRGVRSVAALVVKHSHQIASCVVALRQEADERAQADDRNDDRRLVAAYEERIATSADEEEAAAWRFARDERFGPFHPAYGMRAVSAGRLPDGVEAEPTSDVEKLGAWLAELKDSGKPLFEIDVPRLSVDCHVALLREFGAYLTIAPARRLELIGALSRLLRTMKRGKPGPVAARELRTALVSAYRALVGRSGADDLMLYRDLSNSKHPKPPHVHGAFVDYVRAIEVAADLEPFSILPRADKGDFPNIFK